MVFKALLIDVDGTAVDCEPRNRSVIEDIARNAGFDIQPHHWDFFAGTSHETIWGHLSGDVENFTEGTPEFKKAYPTAEHFEKACEAGYKSRAHDIQANPAVIEIVHDFLANGKPVVAVSNTNTDIIKSALESTGYPVGEFIDAIGKDRVIKAEKRPKPAPDPYYYGLEKLNKAIKNGSPNLQIAPQDCLVLEDSKTGLRAALEFGATVIQITDYSIPPDSDIMDLTNMFNARYAGCKSEELLELYQGLCALLSRQKQPGIRPSNAL